MRRGGAEDTTDGFHTVQHTLDKWLLPRADPSPPIDIEIECSSADVVVSWEGSSLYKLRRALSYFQGVQKGKTALRRRSINCSLGSGKGELCWTGEGVVARTCAHARVIHGDAEVHTFIVDVDFLSRMLNTNRPLVLWAAVRKEDVLWGFQMAHECPSHSVPLIRGSDILLSEKTAFYEAVLSQKTLSDFLQSGGGTMRVQVSEQSPDIPQLPVRFNGVTFTSKKAAKDVVLSLASFSEWDSGDVVAPADTRVAGIDVASLKRWYAFDFEFQTRAWKGLLRDIDRARASRAATLTFCTDGTLHVRIDIGDGGDATIALDPVITP